MRFLLLTAISAIASLAAPALAAAQSSQGALAVAATILPAPASPRPTLMTLSLGVGGDALLSLESMSAGAEHAVTTFVRLTHGDGDDSDFTYIAQPTDSANTMRFRPSSANTRLLLERLITAGT